MPFFVDCVHFVDCGYAVDDVDFSRRGDLIVYTVYRVRYL
jgi:hypothetical protein